MQTVGDIIRAKREKLKLKQTAFARLLEVSSQLLGMYERNERNPKTEFRNRWKKLYNQDLPMETNVSHETIVLEPPTKYETPTITSLVESNRLLAEANKKLADAHFLIAKNNDELIQKIKSNSLHQEENLLDVESILGGLQELLIDLGTGKRWKSKHEADVAVRKVLLGDLQSKNAEADNHDSSGRLHKAK